MDIDGSRLLKISTLFRIFKYSVYLLLCANVVLFFMEESVASLHTLNSSFSIFDLFERFVMTIDTASWVVLLLIFELETYVLEDDVIQGHTKWFLNSVRLVCYVLIVYSCYGYCVKVYQLYQSEPIAQMSTCSAQLEGFSYMSDMDEYEVLNKENCANLQPKTEPASLSLLGDTNTIVTSGAVLAGVKQLAWVDVINSVVWIIVVVLLQIDVLIELSRTERRGAVAALNRTSKGVCYSILLAAAVYWGVSGELLDFWDAFLWIVAFVFIELNIFRWHEEIQQDKFQDKFEGKQQPDSLLNAGNNNER